MKHKYYLLIIAALIVIFAIRELFHYSFSRKADLQLQAEQIKTRQAVTQIQTSRAKQAELESEIERLSLLIGLGKQDIEEKESALKRLRIKISEYDKKDRFTISRFSDLQLDSSFRARYAQPDSLRDWGTKTNPR